MAMRRLYDKAKAAAKSFKIESLVFVPETTREPPDEMIHLFKTVCASLDDMAELEPADPLVSQAALVKSKIPDQLEEICKLLIMDCNKRAGTARPPPMETCDGINSCDDATMTTPRQLANSSKFGSTCADLFVQCHVVHELCMRAIKDQPLGVLPLVLDSLRRILVEAQYDFLPHQTIHRPIANLITFCARYDALHLRGSYSSSSSSSNSNNNNNNNSSSSSSSSWRGSSQKNAVFDFSVYKERVASSLSQLIFVIWHKITENPPVLDFFTVLDTRTVFTASKPPMRPQMDVLTAVIGLIDHPSLGARAKEVVVAALALNDQRVDAFLVEHTTFVYSLVADLARCFLLAVDSLASEADEGSPYKLPRLCLAPPRTSEAAAHRSDSSQQGSTTFSYPPPNRSKDSTTNALVGALRFYEAAVAACEQSISPRQQRGKETVTSATTTAMGSGGGCGKGSSTLLSALLQVYVGVFLEGPVRTSLLVRQRDVQAVAAAAVVRVLLLELLALRRTGALTLATARYLCWQSYFGPRERVTMCDEVDVEGLMSARKRTAASVVDDEAPSGSGSGGGSTSANIEIVETLMEQAASASGDAHMSVSALLLLSSLLQCAPLTDAASLMRLPSRPARRAYARTEEKDRDTDQCSGTDCARWCERGTGGLAGSEAATDAAPSEDVTTPATHAAAGAPLATTPMTPPPAPTTAAIAVSTAAATPVQLGVRLSRMYEDTTKWVSHVSIDYSWASDGHAYSDGHGRDHGSELRRYVDAAAVGVLCRLAGQLSALLRPRGDYHYEHDGGRCQAVDWLNDEDEKEHGGQGIVYEGAALLDLLSRRIADLPSLCFEQQVATSTLVNHCVGSLVAVAIVRGRWPQAPAPSTADPPSADAESAPALAPTLGLHLQPDSHIDPTMYPEYAAVQGVLRAVLALWEQPGLQTQLTRVQDCDRKLTLLRDALAEPTADAKGSACDNTQRSAHTAAILSRESASARRCLETGVVVREMALELRAAALAGHRLLEDMGNVFLFAKQMELYTQLPRRCGRDDRCSADAPRPGPRQVPSELATKEVGEAEAKMSPSFILTAGCIDSEKRDEANNDNNDDSEDPEDNEDNEEGLFAMPGTLARLETLTHRSRYCDGNPASAGRARARPLSAASASASDMLAAAVAMGVVAFAAHHCLPSVPSWRTAGQPAGSSTLPMENETQENDGVVRDLAPLGVAAAVVAGADVDAWCIYVDTSADVDSDSEDEYFRAEWASLVTTRAKCTRAAVSASTRASADAVGGSNKLVTPVKVRAGNSQRRHVTSASATSSHSPPPPPPLVLFSPASAAYAALAQLATPPPCDDQRASLFLAEHAAASRDLADLLGCEPDELWAVDDGHGCENGGGSGSGLWGDGADGNMSSAWSDDGEMR